MIRPKAIVLSGEGINCDVETAWALELAGFDPARVHASDFLADPGQLFKAQMLVLPGGFSFGDEIASGKVLAIEIKHRAQELIYDYIASGHLVLGICNGFQVLVQLGMLPFSEAGAPRVVSLTHNAGGKFLNCWTELHVENANASPFLQSLSVIQLPIRHGEGRIVIAPGKEEQTQQMLKKHIVLRYSTDINGSYQRIAALTNRQGNVFGLMPHPEAFVRWSQHPSWSSWARAQAKDRLPASYPLGMPDGLAILTNAARTLS